MPLRRVGVSAGYDARRRVVGCVVLRGSRRKRKTERPGVSVSGYHDGNGYEDDFTNISESGVAARRRESTDAADTGEKCERKFPLNQSQYSTKQKEYRI